MEFIIAIVAACMLVIGTHDKKKIVEYHTDGDHKHYFYQEGVE